MKSRKLLAAALMLTFPLLQGCLYTDISFTVDDNLDRTTLGDKVGRSSSQTVMWLFTWGDSGVHAAAKEGELETIHHADGEVFAVLFGLYGRYTTVVYGE